MRANVCAVHGTVKPSVSARGCETIRPPARLTCMSFVSRGFGGRRRSHSDLGDRLPPGQYAESGFPVLTAGPTPHIEPSEWGLRIDGMVGAEREWTWDEFVALPHEDVHTDIHCVTKWSKFDTDFRGVSLDVLL